MGSPSSKAQSAASNEQQINNAEIQKAIAYTNTAATNTQNAIANAGPNPYFGAAENMSPAAYKVDPNNTVNFGAQGPPGTSQGGISATPSGTSAPSTAPPPAAPVQNNPAPSQSKTQPVARSNKAQ